MPVKSNRALPQPQPMNTILVASTTATPAASAHAQVRNARVCPDRQNAIAIVTNSGSMMPAAPRRVMTSQPADGGGSIVCDGPVGKGNDPAYLIQTRSCIRACLAQKKGADCRPLSPCAGIS